MMETPATDIGDAMPIPSAQDMMVPLLQHIQDGETHHRYTAVEALAKEFQITDAEREQRLPSGALLFLKRVDWALQRLFWAELLERPIRGHIRITASGQDILHNNPDSVNVSYLNQLVSAGTENSDNIAETADTPEERMAKAHEEARKALVDQLLETVKERSPSFFERLVIDLMVKMDYGVPEGEDRPRSRDGGIDGIIRQDPLGLDTIYLQAKRWDNTSVGRPEIQRFYGALNDQPSQKGVYITSSSFTADAKNFANRNGIILIDGGRLAALMIEHEVGITTEHTYEVKKVSSDYFDEE